VANTKQRILDVTADLFRKYGYTGTGLKQVVASANAPFGSLYHHFPGGKEQLGDEVIRRSGRMYEELVTTIVDAAPDLITGVRDAFAGAAVVLEHTDYADACPIATVALEVASSNETLRIATADVFEGWITAMVDRLVSAGAGRAKARDVAILVIEQLEGAFLLCRALRTTRPMEVAGDAAAEAVRSALPRRRR
jgi:AcrR family transcriptional regulator